MPKKPKARSENFIKCRDSNDIMNPLLEPCWGMEKGGRKKLSFCVSTNKEEGQTLICRSKKSDVCSHLIQVRLRLLYCTGLVLCMKWYQWCTERGRKTCLATSSVSQSIYFSLTRRCLMEEKQKIGRTWQCNSFCILPWSVPEPIMCPLLLPSVFVSPTNCCLVCCCCCWAAFLKSKRTSPELSCSWLMCCCCCWWWCCSWNPTDWLTLTISCTLFILYFFLFFFHQFTFGAHN